MHKQHAAHETVVQVSEQMPDTWVVRVRHKVEDINMLRCRRNWKNDPMISTLCPRVLYVRANVLGHAPKRSDKLGEICVLSAIIKNAIAPPIRNFSRKIRNTPKQHTYTA